MKRSQIAAQLYTARDLCRNTDDFADTCAKIRKIGYEAIQVSGIGPVPEADIVKVVQDNGLTICATHENAEKIVTDTDSVIAHLKAIHCTRTAYPFPAGGVPATHGGMVSFAKKLNAAAIKMASAGIELSYHNHDLEFVKYDGEIALDTIYKNAPAISAELDTFWVQAGGQNPVDWINKLSGRMSIIHLKEYGIRIAERPRTMLPIGDGNLNWAEILPAAEKAGVQYFIVEQDDCNGMHPLDALKRSFDFLCTFAEK